MEQAVLTICPNCRTTYQGVGFCAHCNVPLSDCGAYMQWMQQQQYAAAQPVLPQYGGGQMMQQQVQYAPQQQAQGGLCCPRCGSVNVSAQAVNEVYSKTQHRGIFWWMLVGWWWIPIKWFFFAIPALIVKIFSWKRTYVKSRTVTRAVCQNCGNNWVVK